MKERLQRERRERLAIGPVPSQSSFNSYSITPGTTWMHKVEAYLCEFIENKRKHDDKWRNLSVVFSGCQDPGEGEQKIMEYLRKQGQDGGRHCIWSNDADSVLLSLTTRIPNITMVSERPKSGVSTYTVFDIDLLRDQIADRYSSLLAQEPGDGNGETKDHNIAHKVDRLYSLVDDLVFMTLFAGNDFLPPVSFVMEWLTEPDFIDNLWAMYGHLPEKHQCLHDRGMINPRAFRELLKVFVAEGEERSFRKHVGVTALGSQLTALRIRRMEWDLQRKKIEVNKALAGACRSAENNGEMLASAPMVSGDDDSGLGAKRKKGRNASNSKEPRGKAVRTRGTVPYVWRGPVVELAGVHASACDVALLAGSAPLAADAALGFLALDPPQSTSLLALDGRPLISPMMISSFDYMAWLAGHSCKDVPVATLEVFGAIGSNKIKWLQTFAKMLQLECTVRSSSDSKFESECKKWKRRRFQPGGDARLRKEDGTMSATIVIGDLDVCPPTYIVNLRTKASAPALVGDLCQAVAVVGEDDWDMLHADARTERRRDAELAEWRQGFYRRHYREKSPQFVQNLCTYYVDALGWTAMYYFAGEVSSWEFAWPDEIEASHSGVAPLASDLLAFLDPKMEDWQYVPISDRLPPLAREHMLSVMPRGSWPLLLSEEEQGLAHLLHDSKYSDITRQEVRCRLANNVSADGVPVVRVWL
ncbi:exonuclease II Exo2 [Coemansia sp. RSA 1694]|nr:exonuclease II Exo2 [Coemansia sp. RSA 1694]